MAEADLPERAAGWFLRTARLRAVEAIEGDGWVAVFDPAHPRSHDGNRILLTRDVQDPIALLDRTFRDRDLKHRALACYGQFAGANSIALLNAGFVRQEMVLMTASPADLPRGATTAAEADETTVSEFAARIWHAEAPDLPGDVVAQLVDRRNRLDLAGQIHRLAITLDERIVASTDVCVRDDMAEIDGVAVDAEYRGRGLGNELLVAAGDVARAAGVSLVVLEALTNDWPRTWYANHGFTDVGFSQGFVQDSNQ